MTDRDMKELGSDEDTIISNATINVKIEHQSEQTKPMAYLPMPATGEWEDIFSIIDHGFRDPTRAKDHYLSYDGVSGHNQCHKFSVFQPQTQYMLIARSYFEDQYSGETDLLVFDKKTMRFTKYIRRKITGEMYYGLGDLLYHKGYIYMHLQHDNGESDYNDRSKE
eukprot:102201_1